MSFQFKPPRIFGKPAPRKPREGLFSFWQKDPKTGRLTQGWRSSDDDERSCTGRLLAA